MFKTIHTLYTKLICEQNPRTNYGSSRIFKDKISNLKMGKFQ